MGIEMPTQQAAFEETLFILLRWHDGFIPNAER